MFYGSDTHAESAAAIFSIIASCRLHKLDPEQYLDEIFRILPFWPKDPSPLAKTDPGLLGKADPRSRRGDSWCCSSKLLG